MQPATVFIEHHLWAVWISLVISFIVLSKCADIFVDSAVGIAHKFNVNKLVIGIVLVSLANTAPELSVSLNAALKGNPLIDILAFIFVIFDHTLSSIEGAILVVLFAIYIVYLFNQHKNCTFMLPFPLFVDITI